MVQHHGMRRPAIAKRQGLYTAYSGRKVFAIGREPLSMNALAFPYDDRSRRKPGTRRSSDIVRREHVSLMIDAVPASIGGERDKVLDREAFTVR